MSYVPSATNWEDGPPAALRLPPEALAAAPVHHRAHESAWPRDFIPASGRYVGVPDEPAASIVLGPVRARGGPNGIVLHGGRIAAEWGDTSRADMTFSVAKSYLAILAG